MLEALFYALRFLVVSTILSLLAYVIVGGLTQSEAVAGVAIAVVNAFVLFTTVDRFVDAKLDAHEPRMR